MKQEKLDFDLSFLDDNKVSSFSQLNKEGQSVVSARPVDNADSDGAGALRFLYKIFINIVVYGGVFLVLAMFRSCTG